MGRRPKTTDDDKNYGKRGATQEKTVLMTLKEMVKSDGKAYYILWRCAPELLPKYTREHPIKTFEDLKGAYPNAVNADERICESYFYEENCIQAVKWLYNRQHTSKMLKLYDTFYEKAMSGDVQAFKAISDFSDKFFSSTGESELLRIIHDTELEKLENEEDEDFSF